MGDKEFKKICNIEKVKIKDKPKRIIRRIKELIRNPDSVNYRGFKYFFKTVIYIYIFPVYLFFIKQRQFVFKNKKIDYFIHKYNNTWINERIIEVPLILSLIKGIETNEILEIGNVLGHYVKRDWDVIDKYEKGIGVINQDIENFKAVKKYNKIISISTIEHVGFDENDENTKDDDKILNSLNHLKENCLIDGGEIIFTVPVGWNSNLDDLLFKEKIKFNEVYYFKRISWDNQWAISTKEEVLKTKFAKPYIGANGLILGVIKNEECKKDIIN